MTKNRIEFEKNVVDKMIAIYCTGHKHGKTLCSECQELMEYAHKRLDSCKFGEDKTFCSKCTIHCYQPEKRDTIKQVMRYSGPRMLFHHPIVAIKHFLQK
ncbi:MAG: nitrous oxide-stimulated promoter family protein [Christensenellales bacterium]